MMIFSTVCYDVGDLVATKSALHYEIELQYLSNMACNIFDKNYSLRTLHPHTLQLLRFLKRFNMHF